MPAERDVLDRWGRYAATRPRRVILAWLLIAAVLGLAARSISNETVSTLTLPGAESQEAVEVLQRSFPLRAGDYLDIVFAAPGGVDAPDVRSRVEAFV
ncbi:MAG: hypothetical protein WEA81_02025, partial [Dehalococcoidia bacterium]